MKVIYSDRVKEASKDLELLRQATDYLETSVISPRSAPKVTVEWDLAKDNQYTLRLSDWAATSETEFGQDELKKNGNNLQFRLLRLWGDVLEKRSDKEIEQLLRANSEN